MIPRFSICIPARDRPERLRWAIKSVLGQTFEDFEVIVSDNASSKPLRDMLPEVVDPRIRWIRRESLLTATDHWEVLLRESIGEFTLMLADDDGLVPSTLAYVDRLAQKTLAQCIHVGHWRYTHPLGHGPGENCLFPKAYSGLVEQIDGRSMTLSLLSVWGIKVDEPAATLTLPDLHSSGFFMGRQAIEALYKRGLPLCAQPFADIGFGSIVLEAGEMVSLDLPLAIIGLDVASHLTHPIPGGRRLYDYCAGDMHWAPLRAITFANLGVASNLDMWRHWTTSRVNEAPRLTSAFYMSHAAELFDDKIRDLRTFKDVLEWIVALWRLPGRDGLLIGITFTHRRFSPSWLRRLVARLRNSNAISSVAQCSDVSNPQIAAGPLSFEGTVLGFSDLVGAACYLEELLLSHDAGPVTCENP